MTSSAPLDRSAWPTSRSSTGATARVAAKNRAQAQYGELRDPPVAFGLAAVLDELARHLHDLAALPRRPPAVRRARRHLVDPRDPPSDEDMA